MVATMKDVAVILPTPTGQKLYVISLADLAMLLQRALNTHGDIPRDVLTLSDAVDVLISNEKTH